MLKYFFMIQYWMAEMPKEFIGNLEEKNGKN